MSRLAIYDLGSGKLENVLADGHRTDGYELAGKGVATLPDDFDENTHDFAHGEVVLSRTKALDAIRAERFQRLLATDWTQTGDQSEAVKQRWAPYRQALKDFPETVEDPFAPVWPEPPS